MERKELKLSDRMQRAQTIFHVTYEVVTPESAEDGDAAEHGFVLPGGWREELKPDVFGEAAGKLKAACALALREAIDLIGCCEDSGTWFTEADGRDDYRTGANERRSLHCPDNITGSSYRRIARLVGA